MSKKKSYMDKNNIISEGILDKILKSILPTAANTLKDKSNKSYVSSTEKKIQKIKAKKQEVDKELEDVMTDLEKKLKKRFPDKYKKHFKKSVMGV